MKKILTILMLLTLFPIKADALVVAPVVIDGIEVEPGGYEFVQIEILSEKEKPVMINWLVQEFVAKGEEGQQEYIVGETGGITDWITLPEESYVLTPNETLKLPVSIAIPAGAEPGGYYATLFFTEAAADEDGSVGIVTRVGIPILVKAAGEVIESGELVSFETVDGKFFAHVPVSFTSRLQNTGTVHVKPSGTILIKNLFGRTVAELPANLNESNVLPDSARQVKSSWIKIDAEEPAGFFAKAAHEWRNFALGRYTADLEMIYGTEGQTFTASACFWVFPWHLFLTVILVLAAIIGAIILYNKMIIRKAINKKKTK
ncbi:MAG: hypothetical protein ABIG32_02865 [Candidatus Uhrbacteria bacterium]|nr:hypothetical protein [Patescibacteria group bacterium]MBU1907175.1 hypothetical protein [Patescibacteria group bacterium]